MNDLEGQRYVLEGFHSSKNFKDEAQLGHLHNFLLNFWNSFSSSFIHIMMDDKASRRNSFVKIFWHNSFKIFLEFKQIYILIFYCDLWSQKHSLATHSSQIMKDPGLVWMNAPVNVSRVLIMVIRFGLGCDRMYEGFLHNFSYKKNSGTFLKKKYMALLFQ